MEKRQVRKAMNKIGLVLCLSTGAMIGCFCLGAFILFPGDDWVDRSGISYILGCICIGVILLFWKKPAFFTEQVFQKQKPAHAGSIFSLISLIFLVQMVYPFFYNILEGLFNLLGYTLADSEESATQISAAWSMGLYVCLFGPITEELLFRGAILRTLLPYGEKFAILTSSVLFGFYHGNLPQGIAAVFLGLILGLTAARHSIFWSILLHIFNNCLLSSVPLLPDMLQTLCSIFFLLFSICGFCQCIKRWPVLKSYLLAIKNGRQKILWIATSVFLAVFLLMGCLQALLGISKAPAGTLFLHLF